MRIALVGTSHVHTPDFIEVCAGLPWARLVGITHMDASAPLALDIHRLVVPSIDDLPAHDVAVVATDIASHDRVCRNLDAPMVFIEKPLSLDGPYSDRLAQHLVKSNQWIEMGFFLRHSPAFLGMIEMLRSGHLGAVQYVQMAYCHHGLSKGWLRDWPSHLDRERMGGGPFTDLAVHLIDAGRAMLGNLVVTGCNLDRRASENDLDVQGQAILHGERGELVHIWASGVAPTITQRIGVVCEGGELVLDGGRLERLKDETCEVLLDDDMPTPASGLRSALERFRDGRDPMTRAADAVAASTLMDELARAAGS